MIHGFPPIAGEDARVLILGTVPSAMSLQKGQYYGNPRNAFWPIVESLFAGGRQLGYPERVALVQASGVAIWDVLEAADRTGSLDGHITKPVPNDIPSFLRDRPAIRSVFFNGAKAEQLFLEHVEPTLATAMRRDISFVRLPSTSPANARLPFTQKLAAWRRVRDEAAVD